MKTGHAIPNEISKLRERVDRWRATRATQRGAMPEALWLEAGELADKYGVYAVARGAGLGYEGVRKRSKGPVAASHRASSLRSLAGAFVELPIPSLSGGEGHEVAVVELRDARGRSLAVRVMPQALSHLAEVATTLWSLS